MSSEPAHLRSRVLLVGTLLAFAAAAAAQDRKPIFATTE